MSAITQSRIERMRVVAAARTMANKAPATLQAVLALCTWSESNLRAEAPLGEPVELAYSGYSRIPATLVGDGSLYSLKTSDNIIFPPYKGQYPVVVTHLVVWDQAGKRRTDITLNGRPCILGPGDSIHIPPNTFLVPSIEFWEHA